MLLSSDQDMLSEFSQGCAMLDRAKRNILGLYPDWERIFAMEVKPDGSWGPKLDENGLFISRLTDDDLMGQIDEATGLRPMSPFRFGVQELGQFVFGITQTFSQLPSELNIMLGTIRA